MALKRVMCLIALCHTGSSSESLCLLKRHRSRRRQDIMERAFKIGCRVVFFDSLRQPHDAIVTNWFHNGPDGQTVAEYVEKYSNHNTPTTYLPCCNIVFVSSDSSKTDPYGRQLERQTSCSYGRSQGPKAFVGMCWCWPDELEEALELASKALEST
jgi:hypothetical protein